MRIEEAIVYVLSTSGYGMKTERIAEEINSHRLHVRKDGNRYSARIRMTPSAHCSMPLIMGRSRTA